MLMGSMLQGGSKPPTIPSRKAFVAGGIYVQSWVSPLREPCLFQIYERDPNFWKSPCPSGITGVARIHLRNLPNLKLPLTLNSKA